LIDYCPFFSYKRAGFMRKFCVLLALGISSVAVRGDIIPSYVSAVPTGQGTTVITYEIDFTAEQNGTNGDFFTIYDFGSIVPNSSTQPSGWTFSTQAVGNNPAKTAAPDDPGVLNLTWTYTGSTTSSGTGLGPFTVTVPGTFDVELNPTRNGFFAALGTLVVGPNAGSQVGNVGQLVIPVVVPEPASLALLLFGSGLLLSRSRKR
jgi:hypothetical protein